MIFGNVSFGTTAATTNGTVFGYGHGPVIIQIVFGPPPGYMPPPVARPQLKDTRTRAEKIADLAARASTTGEREAAMAKLAMLRAKGEV